LSGSHVFTPCHQCSSFSIVVVAIVVVVVVVAKAPLVVGVVVMWHAVWTNLRLQLKSLGHLSDNRAR